LFSASFLFGIPQRIFPIWQVELGLQIRTSFAPAADLIGSCLLLKPLNFFGFIELLVYSVKL
jgi:hypothetical protein